MELNIYKYAAKNRLRFSYKGTLTAEDLFQLSLQDLDTIYKSLKNEEKASAGESLLETTQENTDLAVKIALVKDIFTEKKNEIEARVAAVEDKKKKQRIAEIIAEKKDAALRDMSVEELEKLLKN